MKKLLVTVNDIEFVIEKDPSQYLTFHFTMTNPPDEGPGGFSVRYSAGTSFDTGWPSELSLEKEIKEFLKSQSSED